MATYQVNSSSDDCRRILTPDLWNLGYAQQIAGSGSSSAFQYGGGMRFTNIAIAQGAVIEGAYLTFRAYQSLSGVACNTRISAEDVDNAITFADDSAAFDTRWAGRTTARVNWDAIPAWSYHVTYNSIDIKSVIQEVVDRPGWVSGNAIVIFWEDFDDRSDHNDFAFRSAQTFDNSPTFAPKLIIGVSMPTVTTQEVTSIVTTTATGNGNITDLGGTDPTAHGHCWTTTPDPTTSNDVVDNGATSSTGAFTSALTGLVSGTEYFVRAYATNTQGTSYGVNVHFIAGAVGGELRGDYAVVEERFHYVDAYGVERFIQGEPVT